MNFLADFDIVNVLAGVGLFFVLLFVAAYLLSHLRGRAEVYPYAPIPVLTPAESHFHATLVRCVPKGTLLLMKVRLADFLEVSNGGENHLRHFGRISQKHADFLLVDEESFQPLLVIELDDATHRNNQRTMESDATKGRIYEAAKVGLLRMRAMRQYDEKELRQLLAQHLVR